MVLLRFQELAAHSRDVDHVEDGVFPTLVPYLDAEAQQVQPNETAGHKLGRPLLGRLPSHVVVEVRAGQVADRRLARRCLDGSPELVVTGGVFRLDIADDVAGSVGGVQRVPEVLGFGLGDRYVSVVSFDLSCTD
ncbi:hypothetical protein [Amycolatopsis sp. NPDC051903]|uniref:hypothetical protein n=1 Tax=Amycolatopsis sp. NPDC051903 TaxID=3363936 RepID=UPI0037943DD3